MTTHSHRHIPKASFISVGAALLVNVVLFLVASMAGIINEDILQDGNVAITLSAVILSTVFGGLLAIVVFAIMLKVFKDKAVLWFQRLGIVTLLVTLVFPFTITDADADGLFYGTLILMHIGAGLAMIWLLPKHTAEIS